MHPQVLPRKPLEKFLADDAVSQLVRAAWDLVTMARTALTVGLERSKAYASEQSEGDRKEGEKLEHFCSGSCESSKDCGKTKTGDGRTVFAPGWIIYAF